MRRERVGVLVPRPQGERPRPRHERTRATADTDKRHRQHHRQMAGRRNGEGTPRSPQTDGLMAVNITELRALVTQCESERLEFKKSTGDLKGGMETLCAFL